MIFGLGRKLIILAISVIFILRKTRHKVLEKVVKNSSTSDEQRPSTGIKIQAQIMLALETSNSESPSTSVFNVSRVLNCTAKVPSIQRVVGMHSHTGTVVGSRAHMCPLSIKT